MKKKDTIFDIVKECPDGGIFLQKIIGFLVVKVKRKYLEESDKKLGVSEYFIHTYPLSISDYDLTCNVDVDDEEIIGLISTNDCYEVFGENPKTKVFGSIGYIMGKATPVDEEYWDRKLNKDLKK